MEYEKLNKLILKRLRENLPEHLSYHSVMHVKDVIDAVEKIAKSEGVSDEDLLLLKTAALFHDTGFLYGSKNHEEKSCEIAVEYLSDNGYSDLQIEKIKGMIMATKIPQTPKNHLEQIVADADLDYLGRDDFFVIGDKLFEELSMFGIVNSERDWNLLQEKFLESHHYFTETAINTRKEKKQINLDIIKTKLKNN
ncbi:HD domain-containing protein [Chryseobacterium sp. Ch-15]|uniref:HD domain-containing protein n=1 Tax=Chryseobacterium muglaense TaxID=2893752 RepID=A0A9Q3URE4_9FLAO|nr:HD domain-containing protein [Chryseobacterium muglaense]MBD3907142.1 HD domain-containing protein [Chryseobacterium muglaense]MCC9033769.1 HD domain-containing protein [Chryseobacterium muglaense]MCM2556811.1 HD domain-containing protein [Chryseobacterium muglaense]